jgi:hypothetical protein
MSLSRPGKTIVAFLLICASLRAQTPTVVYETSTNYSGKFNVSTNEYGDEIILMGNKQIITQMQIEYFGDFTPTGDEVARVRFYQNTGPSWMGNNQYLTPANPPLWEATFPVGLGFSTATLAVPYVNVPLRFTWTVQFFGIPMNSTEKAGLLIYGDPIVGSSFNDFWELRPDGWVPQRIPGVPKNNFAARFMAVDAAPPPPSLITTIQGNSLKLSWPAAQSGFYLESRPAVDGGVWSPVMPLALRVGDFYETTVPIESGNRLFRLNTKPEPPLLISMESGSVRLRWSSAIGGQTLQTKSGVASTWTDIATPSRPVGDYYEITLPAGADVQFFRLVKKI